MVSVSGHDAAALDQLAAFPEREFVEISLDWMIG